MPSTGRKAIAPTGAGHGSASEQVPDLSTSFRSTILAQFAQFLEAIADNHGLDDLQKTDLLYEALDELIKVIERISRRAPEVAPELWTHRADKSEDVFDFIRRVYGAYIPKGLRKSDILRTDPSLYQAIFDWKKKHKRNPDFTLPTKKQDNDRLLSQLERKLTIGTVVGGMPPKHREYLRLYRTMASRQHKRKRAHA